MHPQPAPPIADDYLDLSFKAIVEQSITGIYVIQDEIFVYSNETWAHFFGRSRAEIVGMSLRDLVPPSLAVRLPRQGRLPCQPGATEWSAW